MAQVDDYSPSDDDDSEDDPGSASAASSGSANSTNQASPSPQKDTPYVPWSAFTSANSAVDSDQASKLTNQVSSDAANASGAIKSASDADTDAIDSNYGNGDSTPKTGNTAVTAPASIQKDATEKVVNPNPPQAVNPTSEQTLPFQGSLAPKSAPAGQTVDVAPAKPATTTLAGQDAADNPAPMSPWSALTNSSTQPLKPTTSAPNAGAQALEQAAPRSEALNAQGLSATPAGSPNLEASMSPDAWTKLTGQVQNAQSEANALGQGEAGVQGLLDSKTGAPTDSAFDAALLNSGNGQQFRGLSQQYGNNGLNNQLTAADQNAQNLWEQFTANQKAAQAAQLTATETPLNQTPAIFTPTSSVETTDNPISSIGSSVGAVGASGQPLDALGLDEGLAPPPESGLDHFFADGSTQNSDPNNPQFGQDSTPGSTGSAQSNGQVDFPDVPADPPGSKGIAWSSFWGDAKGAPADGSTWNPASLGLTSAQWYAIGEMTPSQRANWWAEYGQGRSDSYKGSQTPDDIIAWPNPLD